MQGLRTFKIRAITRTLSCAVALFAILALLIGMGGPIGSVAAHNVEKQTSTPEGSGVYRPLYDFTGDGRTDFMNVVIGTAGTPITWKALRNPADPAPNQAFIRVFDFGISGDSLSPHDYYGDGHTEIAVWRTGVYYRAPFPDGTGPVGPLTYLNWGASTGENLGRDGDYDGDGKDDPTTVRLSGGLLTWIYNGSTSGPRSVRFGQTVAGRSTLAFQGADFNGDGRDDFVFCTASTTTGQNTYWIGDSVTGAVIMNFNWGNFITDYFVNPDDYTGDGKADAVAYRAGGSGPDAGAWYIRDTATGTNAPVVIFGIPDPNFMNEDAPVRGNFDGDNKADIAVWRKSTATYYWINSSNGSVGAQQWGNPALTADFTEFPIPTLFTF